MREPDPNNLADVRYSIGLAGRVLEVFRERQTMGPLDQQDTIGRRRMLDCLATLRAAEAFLLKPGNQAPECTHET